MDLKILVLLRLFLLALSLAGYVLLLSKRVQTEFAISLTIAGITSCLFFSGILNLLPETAVLLLVGGLFCFILQIKEHGLWAKLARPGCVFLILSGIGLFCILYGSKFVNLDDFVHWASVVKLLIRNNRFPTQLDKYLPAFNYPAGTACWIYYWLFISGTRAEYIQIFAQHCMFLGMAVSLFPLSRTVTGKILTAVTVTMMLVANQDLYSIQVDNVLAIAFVSAIAFSVYYREDLKAKTGWLALLCVFLFSIKNSGILLAAFLLLFALPCLRWKKTGLIACVTGASFLLWSKHIQLLFPNASTSKHAISLENYRNVLSEKSREDILEICRLAWNNEVSRNTFVFLLILAAALIAISFLRHEKERSPIRKLSLFSIACYCAHQTGLLCVYLVSMPRSEALRLSHYARYQDTAIVFSAGILLIAVLLLLNTLQSNRKSAAVLIVCCLLLRGGIAPRFQYFARQAPQTLKAREYYDRLVSQCDIPQNARIMTFTDTGEDPYNYYNALSRYYFAPARIKHMDPQTVSWDQFDYVLVLTKSKEAKRFVSESSIPEQTIVVMK